MQPTEDEAWRRFAAASGVAGGLSEALSTVDVSVLVPVRDEAASIDEAARAMLAQTFHGSIEFIFCDGRSGDGTAAALERLAAADPRVRVLDNPGRTIPSALNIGLRAARGEYVARMDAHSFYPPNYVAAGVERLRRGDVAWVSGPALPRARGRVSALVALALGTWLGAGPSRKWGGTAETEIDTGVFAGVWRRATLEALGGWDEGWPANQDSELAARVIADGGRLLCLPEMAAEYEPRDSIAGLARQYFRYGHYRAKTSRRHPHSMRRSHLLAPALTVTAVAAVAGPRPVRRVAWRGLGAYAIALAVAAALVGVRRRRADAAGLPVVLATMHVSWGAGFLAGCARFGPPLAAIARLVRPRG
jgi:glycosyltransferase involved in cell wall biosynthesis